MTAFPRSAPVSSARWRHALSLGALLMLAACGGGGGGDTATQTGGGDGTGGSSTDPKAVALAQALRSGDASALDTATVLAATQTQLDAQLGSYASNRQALFGLTAGGQARAGSLSGIHWDPTHDSSFFTVLDQGRNRVVLPGNWRYSDNTAGAGKVLAVTGEDPVTGARYAAFGGNPLAERGNAAMDTFMKNTVGWLTGRSSPSHLKVVTAHLPGSATYWFPHEARVRSWLTAQVPGVTINGVAGAQATTDDGCDGSALNACLQGADLLVIGRQQGRNVGNSNTPDVYPAGYDGSTIVAAVKAAQARGVPVLYLHHYRDSNDLSGRLLSLFGLAQNNNYFAQEGLKAFDPAALPAAPAATTALQALIRRLETGNFSTTWSGCVNDLGKVVCDNDQALQDEFVTPAKALRSSLRALDAQGLALFDQPGYALEKRLVLLADKYREAVSYPMTKERAGAGFFRAWFSDMAAYIHRQHASAAPDQGSFSGPIPASTPALSRTVSTNAAEVGTREYMTGLYVMPGRSVTLTRSDLAASSVSFGINMLRDTTRLFNTYDRPTMLASPRMPLVSGQPVTITSPFGGPLYLFMTAAPGAPAISVQVNGVTTHPVLRDMKDPSQVAAFKAELASTPTRWAGITTDFLTVHSTVPHMRSTLAAHGNDMTLLADRLWTYMVKDTYELAGFNAASGTFGLPASVSAFCASAGWDCSGLQHRRDVMQHVISDTVAACGAGCSGNPYDQNWALEPLGWGETHEIGHNLQRSRLNIYGGQSGEVSNNIFPVHKRMAFNRATAPTQALTDRIGSTKAVFNLLKASLQPGASTTHVRDSIWTDTLYAANNSERLNFYRQLVEYARHYNSGFTDGWELYTLMYLLDRNFSAGSTSTQWSTVKDGLGFGNYAAYPSTMNGNDFMLIASSRIIGRDMRPVFALWGVTTSAEAGAQVAADGHEAAERLLFPMNNVNAHGSGVGAPVVMSATASYPAGF